MKELMKQISEKEGLQEKLADIRKESMDAGDTQEQFVDKMLTALNEAGIAVEKEEISNLIKENTAIQLPQDELAEISGGGICGGREKCCTKSGSCYGICADGSDSC